MDPYVRYPSKQIPFPSHITITLPFENADSQTERRATMEAGVDFRNDPFSASLCTLSYAASELARYLRKLGNTSVSFATVGAIVTGYQIDISCGDADKSDCGYTITPTDTGMVLRGNSRVGALYAVYTVLNAQGIRWYYPGTEGEIVPEKQSSLVVPIQTQGFAPAMKDGRGLDLFAPLKDSAQFLLWMARNRMNITAEHTYSAPLGDKLGMTFRIGGHMFEPFLDPDLPLSDGRTIWESHPEWYGLPPDGVRRKSDVLKNQFCVSQASLIDYLADILIGRLRGMWKHVDRLDIWGFDNGFGSSCQCDACKKLGNDSDQALYFLSELRHRLDQAEDLHPVTLVACAYEGTKTMEPPTKPIPENLFAHDCVVVYPIHRCYCHDFDDPTCPTNAYYQQTILPWLNQTPRLPMIMGEYYNVSKYEDLPLVFAKRICHELPLYSRWGFTSITYMHPPLYNWGVRALNHMLFAALSWDSDADSDALIQAYFDDLYGTHAPQLRKIYHLVEEASAHVGNYRNWWYSILDTLQLWNGGKPEKELDMTGHFADYTDLVNTLTRELDMRQQALRLLEEEIRIVKSESLSFGAPTAAVTPDQLARELAGAILPTRLYELRRSLIYGADELHLFTLVVKEYILASQEQSDPVLWEQIEQVYDKLAGYFFPHRYISREIEAFCEDALTRSQLRLVVDRRRAWKLKNT